MNWLQVLELIEKSDGYDPDSDSSKKRNHNTSNRNDNELANSYDTYDGRPLFKASLFQAIALKEYMVAQQGFTHENEVFYRVFQVS